MKLLIDENLSIRLPEWLAERDIYAEHVAHRGLQGQPDHVLWEYANGHDLITVTVNVRDYLKLAGRTEIHTGIIAIRESNLTAEEQLWRILSAIDEIQNRQEGHLINQILEVRDASEMRWLEIPKP